MIKFAGLIKLDKEEHRRQLNELLNVEDSTEEFGFAASLSDENAKLKYLINLKKLMGEDLDLGFAAFMPIEEIKLRRNYK